MAYTSPSTAENQNDSEKVYAKEATAAEMKTASLSESSSSFLDWRTSFLSKIVRDQYIKSMVKELEKADNAFIK